MLNLVWGKRVGGLIFIVKWPVLIGLSNWQFRGEIRVKYYDRNKCSIRLKFTQRMDIVIIMIITHFCYNWFRLGQLSTNFIEYRNLRFPSFLAKSCHSLRVLMGGSYCIFIENRCMCIWCDVNLGQKIISYLADEITLNILQSSSCFSRILTNFYD